MDTSGFLMMNNAKFMVRFEHFMPEGPYKGLTMKHIVKNDPIYMYEWLDQLPKNVFPSMGLKSECDALADDQRREIAEMCLLEEPEDYDTD